MAPKRGASDYLVGSTKENTQTVKEFRASGDESESNRRASPEAMSQRKIKQPRSRLKPGVSVGFGSQQQPPTNPFSNVNSNLANGTDMASGQQSGFNFGSSSSFPQGNASGFGSNTTNSFPPTQNGASTQWANNPRVTESAFSFSVGGGSNNPFSSSNGASNNQNMSNGVNKTSAFSSGSIFGSTSNSQHQPSSNVFGQSSGSNQFGQNNTSLANDDGMQISPQASPAKGAVQDSNRPNIFATMSSSSPFQFGQSQQNNSSTVSATPSAPTSTPQPSQNLFSSARNQTPTSSTFDPFGQKPTETPPVSQTLNSSNTFSGPGQTSSNPFGGLVTGSQVKNNTQNSFQPSNTFGSNTPSSQPSQNPTVTGFTSASRSQSFPAPTTSTPNLFAGVKGSSEQSPSKLPQTSSTPFGSTTPNQFDAFQTTTQQSASKQMQTEQQPQTSATPAVKPSSNPFSSLKTSNQPQSSAPPFSFIPTTASSQPPSSPFNSSQLIQASAGSSFDPPSSFSEAQKNAFTRHLDMRSTNFAFRQFLAMADVNHNWIDTCRSYVAQVEKILEMDRVHSGVKRKADESSFTESVKKARASNASEGEPSGSPSKGVSQTSNLFKSIVDSEEHTQELHTPAAVTPEVRSFVADRPSTSSVKQSSGNPFGSASTTSAFNTSSTEPSTNSQATSPFTIKPFAGESAPPVTSTFKQPLFGPVAGQNFMAQFGKQAEEESEKEKQKRKDEDFDSDEDTDASWEEKDKEEQQKRKQKLEEIARSNPLKFTPGKGFAFGASDSLSKPQMSEKDTPSRPSSAQSVSSVFDDQKPGKLKPPATSNIFAHLSDAESGAEGSKAGDADDEDTSDENEEEAPQKPTSTPAGFHTQTAQSADESDDGDSLEDAIKRRQSPKKISAPESSGSNGAGRSLFDRITPADSENEQLKQNPFAGAGQVNGPSLFGQSNFGQSSSPSPFNKNTSPAADHTWKADSPIKFGGSGAPALNFTPATPPKQKNSLLPHDQPEASPSRPFANLFGGSADKPGNSLFSNTSTTPAGSPAKPTSENVGFTFGGPPKTDTASPSPFLFPSQGASTQNTSAFNSVASSRATSPGGDSSAVDSPAEGDAEPRLPQADLTSLSEDEKNDYEVLYENLKVKCLQLNSESKQWEPKGTGPFRLLKKYEDGSVLILCRASPGGKIVLNNRLLKGGDYKHVQKGTVKLTLVGADGKPTAWIARMAVDEDALKMADVLMANRPE